jgi:predicted small metal-binding protein
MDLRIRCDCGHEIQSSDPEDLVERARQHAREEHHMELPAEHLLEMAVASNENARPQKAAPEVHRRDD